MHEANAARSRNGERDATEQAEPETMAFPEVAVLGASAGGVEALVGVARTLPASLPLALLVVLHMPTGASSRLPDIIGRAGPLPASPARHGTRLAPGRILVAPPDHHLIVSDGRVFLVDGARENGFRPAIDPLFRSAARAMGPRTIGVLLSGTMDDGVSGLAAIQAVGGATVVQDPVDAICGALPDAALAAMTPEHVAPAAGIGPVLAELAKRHVPAAVEPSAAARALLVDPLELPAEGVDVACPDCGGALQLINAGPVPRYRCRVGHVFAPESLLERQGASLEAALWTAVRTLEETATVSGRLAERSRQRGSIEAAKRFDARHVDAARRADVVRQAIEAFEESVNATTEEALAPASR